MNSLFLKEVALNEHNWKLRRKYDEIEKREKRYEERGCDRDMDVLVVAYGFSPRTTDVGYEPVQPVEFSHEMHAGQL